MLSFSVSALLRFIRWIFGDKPSPVIATKPPLIEFDWLRDYGPHWETDCTAFWLDPDTEQEREAWKRRYRPTSLDPHIQLGLLSLANGGLGNLQSASYMQAQQQQSLASAYTTMAQLTNYSRQQINDITGISDVLGLRGLF